MSLKLHWTTQIKLTMRPLSLSKDIRDSFAKLIVFMRRLPVSVRKWQKRQVLLIAVPIHCKVRWRNPELFLILLKEARDKLRLNLERLALLSMK